MGALLKLHFQFGQLRVWILASRAKGIEQVIVAFGNFSEVQTHAARL